MKFIFDHNLPPGLARALNELSQFEIVPLRDQFPINIIDVDLINALAREKDTVLVTFDGQIQKKPHERDAWIKTGLSIVFLDKAWMGLKFWRKCSVIIDKWEAVEEFMNRIETGKSIIVKARSNKYTIIP